VAQVKALARAGSELVRVTVNNDESPRPFPTSESAWMRKASRLPWSGTSISMATSCSRLIPPAPRRWASFESIRVMSAAAPSAIRSSPK